jgi:hypothetical protein
VTFAGGSAIDFLARRSTLDDSAASSHWRQQHAAFRFSGSGFEGLAGFGRAIPRTRPRQAAHRLLQAPLRGIGRRYPEFAEIDSLAARMCSRQNRIYDLDVLRNAITVAYMRALVPERLSAGSTACVIGDGFATLVTLLLGSRSAGRVILVNLTKTLLVDLWYLRLWLGVEEFERNVVLATEVEPFSTVDSPAGSGSPRVIAVQAEHHELLRHATVDTAFNIVSMGEMDPPVIAGYFADLRAASARSAGGVAFYCCNRVDKRLPDGTITRFAEYPWSDADRLLDDGPCPWHQKYYAFRYPFYFAYDGPIHHRLALLAAATG